MRKLMVFGCAAIVGMAIPGSAEIVKEMTPALIKEAIELGSKNKGDGCYALRSQQPIGGMGCVSTPFSRVVEAASMAKQKYKPFSETDVTKEMLAPELHIHAWPNTHGPGVVSAENVILRPKGAKDLASIIRPTRIDEREASYKNAMGGTWTGKEIMAVFPINALTDDTEVRVIYTQPVCSEGGSWSLSLKPQMTADCGARLGSSLKKVR
jgi:hypothetical protein